MNNDDNQKTDAHTGEGIGVLVAGPMARSLANEAAEKMDPTLEDAYWKTNYARQDYVEPNSPFTPYQPAYRTGYEGRIRHPGKQFEEVETELQHHYEQTKGNSTLSWDKAKRAARDAWNRVDLALSLKADAHGR